MVRLKRSAAVADEPIRASIRARAEAAVAFADARLAEGPPAKWDAEGIYPWAALWAEKTTRERLSQLDAGEPIIVGLWELPHGVTLPTRAHVYVIHPRDVITVYRPEGV